MRLPRPAAAIVLVSIASSLGACRTPAGSTSASPAVIAGLPAASPESVGMSRDRLGRLSAAMQQLVEARRLAGITTLIARHGKIVHVGKFGFRDLEAGAAMDDDAIFRIYSMTKPITGVALMTLYEQGMFTLSDPVHRYIPEFRDLKVAVRDGPRGPILEEPRHPMTMRELMTHTAGLTYGIFSESLVDRMYVDRKVLAFDGTLHDMITRLAGIPLRQQPGSSWHYSIAADVQGYLVEVLSGERLDRFLEARIFKPLDMRDTAFYVPANKAGRLAQLYSYGRDGRLVPPSQLGEGGRIGSATIKEDDIVASYLKPPTFFSGGGGLVSTTRDYMRFCQMLLNGGELDGFRILSPVTVDLMRRNQLPREVREMAPGVGFGLDFAVVTDPVAADGISEGEYFWSGAAGTWFWIDPAEDIVFVGMIQQFGAERPDMRSLSRRLTYQAILQRGSGAGR